MFTLWIPMDDIPAEGRAFSFEDQSMWSDAFAEFGLEFKLVDTEPLKAEVHILKQDNGCLVRGSVTGSLATDCSRCAETAVLAVDCSFEEYEPFPEDENGNRLDAEDEERIDTDLYRRDGEVWELNVAALLWEQFSLDLPGQCLCDPECKGLCAACGANLNTGGCDCERDEGDPRLALLRNLKVNR